MLQDWHYIILLGAVILVAAYAWPRSKKNAPQPSSQSIQNMETALEQFMENMERDNEELAELVMKAQKEAKAESMQKDVLLQELNAKLQQATDRIALLESQPSAALRPIVAPSLEQPHRIAEEPPAQSAEPADTIRSRYAELFELYDQGKSIDAICKKLGLHKGEVQLILGLAKQEESAHDK